MSQSVLGALQYMMDLVGAISGIRGAPDYPEEITNVYPFAIAYVGAGEWHCQAGQKEFRGDLVLELHVSRKDLPRDAEKLMGYVESIPNAIENAPTLNNTCAQVMFPIQFSGLVASQYGSQETLAYIWRVRVSVWSAIT